MLRRKRLDTFEIAPKTCGAPPRDSPSVSRPTMTRHQWERLPFNREWMSARRIAGLVEPGPSFPDCGALHTLQSCTKTLPKSRFNSRENKRTYPMREWLHKNITLCAEFS